MGRHRDFLMFKNWPENWILPLKYCMVIDFDHCCYIMYKFRSFLNQFDWGLPNFQILEKWKKIKFFIAKNMHSSKSRTFNRCTSFQEDWQKTCPNIRNIRSPEVDVGLTKRFILDVAAVLDPPPESFISM